MDELIAHTEVALFGTPCS